MGENVSPLDLEALGRWFAMEVPEATDRLTARLIAGGRSNLTFIVSDGHVEWVVRRPPMGHVLDTAHDVTREYRVMTALYGSTVPVPRTLALCTDPKVLGADFYVMERCHGTAYRKAVELRPLGTDRVRVMSERLVDTLAALHAVDHSAVGLSDLGRPEGFLRRQVRRWKAQIDASRTGDLPGAEELHRLLVASVPQESAPGIVHGDYRLDNLLVDSDCEVAAVLDWEMATLGDPPTDLALMIVYGRLGHVGVPGMPDVSAAAGFLDEDELIERYSQASGRDVSAMNWYLGLASFKLAGILQGIHCRFLAGQTVGDGIDAVGRAVEPLLESGVAALGDGS